MGRLLCTSCGGVDDVHAGDVDKSRFLLSTPSSSSRTSSSMANLFSFGSIFHANKRTQRELWSNESQCGSRGDKKKKNNKNKIELHGREWIQLKVARKWINFWIADEHKPRRVRTSISRTNWGKLLSPQCWMVGGTESKSTSSSRGQGKSTPWGREKLIAWQLRG